MTSQPAGAWQAGICVTHSDKSSLLVPRKQSWYLLVIFCNWPECGHWPECNPKPPSQTTLYFFIGAIKGSPRELPYKTMACSPARWLYAKQIVGFMFCLVRNQIYMQLDGQRRRKCSTCLSTTLQFDFYCNSICIPVCFPKVITWPIFRRWVMVISPEIQVEVKKWYEYTYFHSFSGQCERQPKIIHHRESMQKGCSLFSIIFLLFHSINFISFSLFFSIYPTHTPKHKLSVPIHPTFSFFFLWYRRLKVKFLYKLHT